MHFDPASSCRRSYESSVETIIEVEPYPDHRGCSRFSDFHVGRSQSRFPRQRRCC